MKIHLPQKIEEARRRGARGKIRRVIGDKRDMKKGNRYGTHRVRTEPKGVLPQPANKLDNNMDGITRGRILIDVQTLNMDSASTQINEQAGGDEEENAPRRIPMLDIVVKQGKHRNDEWGHAFEARWSALGDALAGSDRQRLSKRIKGLCNLFSAYRIKKRHTSCKRCVRSIK